MLNCTSYLNADAGYEDADGFAAKLTVADGNVFDGCIAAYNADDGWDLFAKVETGAIGQVVIQNCVAFKNGYVLDENGQEVDAGNGNGFKMGGSSISGHHICATVYHSAIRQRVLIPTAVRILRHILLPVITMSPLTWHSIQMTQRILHLWQKESCPLRIAAMQQGRRLQNSSNRKELRRPVPTKMQ